MKIDLTFRELEEVKQEIQNFKTTYFVFLKENSKNDIAFLSKKIIFFKYIIRNNNIDYRINALTSDYIYLLESIWNKNIRYFYLNVRSIIEHSLRIFNDVSSDNTLTNSELFTLSKNKLTTFKENNVNFNIIEDQYSIACNYVHGNINANLPLAEFFIDSIDKNKEFIFIETKIRQICVLVEELGKLFLYTNASIIDDAFHRRKSILKYLTNEDYLLELRRLVN